MYVTYQGPRCSLFQSWHTTLFVGTEIAFRSAGRPPLSPAGTRMRARLSELSARQAATPPSPRRSPTPTNGRRRHSSPELVGGRLPDGADEEASLRPVGRASAWEAVRVREEPAAFASSLHAVRMQGREDEAAAQRQVQVSEAWSEAAERTSKSKRTRQDREGLVGWRVGGRSVGVRVAS